MKLTVIESSMVHALGYDERIRELEVVFTSGDVYRYVDVDRTEYERLLQAESKGRYMRANIIGSYSEYKVTTRRRRG
jgi:hypothetical protein